ncbi:MAG: hypothetical protein QOI05_2229 [Bradyrhizobium sp.]|nr:hypothetical protein [Bradyrhizobium sp.]
MESPKNEWAWTDVSFAEWRKAVDERMPDIYVITIDDSGVDDEYLMSHWQMKQSPFEFVEWFGIKYDLTPRSEIEWGGLIANP